MEMNSGRTTTAKKHTSGHKNRWGSEVIIKHTFGMMRENCVKTAWRKGKEAPLQRQLVSSPSSGPK